MIGKEKGVQDPCVRESVNSLSMMAVIVEVKELHYTPGGLAVWEGKLHHVGSVYEAGVMRKLDFEFNAIAFSDVALRLNQIKFSEEIAITGFIAPRSIRTQRLVVHITEFKLRS